MDVAPVEADDVEQQPFSKAVLADHLGGAAAALIGQLQRAVLRDSDEPIALHARHSLGDRGAGVVEAVDDPRAKRGDAVLLQLVDGLEVHLGGVDELAHMRSRLLR